MRYVRPALLVCGTMLVASASYAASQVGTTTVTDAFSSASRFFTHCANGYCWVAYHNGTEPVIASSPDGVTWTSQGAVFSAVDPDSAGQWATRFQGTNVIAFGTAPSNPRKRWYRKATLNSNGTVTWSSPTDSEAEQQAGQLEVNSLIANNAPILWFVGAASWGQEAIGSELDNPIWTTPAPFPPGLGTSTAGGFSGGAIFPTGGSDPNDYIVVRATTAAAYTAGAHRLIADRFDASVPIYVSDLAWFNVSMLGCASCSPAVPYGLPESNVTEVKEGTDAQAHVRFAAVRDTSGSVHAVYVNRLDDVVHYKKDVGFNDSWSRLFIDVTASAAAIDRVALGAVSNDNLFLFYSKSDNGIYYRRFDGTNWGGEATLKAASATPLQGALAPMEMASGCSLGIAWVEGSVSPYKLMFASVGTCSTLSTSAAGSTITVDTAEVRMVWDAGVAGGGLSELYGKTEANPGVNRRGSSTTYNVFSTQLNDGSGWKFERSGAGTAQLLEATPTRVRVRQSYNYTAQIRLDRDWSVYAYPRLALDEDIVLLVDQASLRGAQGLHPKGEAACGGANTFYCAGQSDEPNRVWVATDNAGAYSDMLAIAESTPFFGRPGTGYGWNNVLEAGTPNTWLARVHEPGGIFTSAGTYTRRYLVYPYLAGLTSAGTEWQPYANDYRGPDALSISVGSAWSDAVENTASDDYNEAEGAYNLTFSPGVGLTFDIDGGTTTRKKPFFKIRHWRSLADPPSITLNGTTLANDVDYKADVKPMSRGRFCTGPCTELANGGLTSDTNEYLAEPTRNFTLNFTGANTLYLGSDNKFRGVNIALATKGIGTADLNWQYWNGTIWTSLETAGIGFTDQTNQLTRSGTVYWTSDPPSWATRVDIAGDPSLYYVRVNLASGSYTQNPIESVIKTDILLLQYCSDITANGQTFVVPQAATTSVELISFQARGGDQAVELSWETASELNNLGFHIYRARSAEGPYERITQRPIPGLGSSPSGARYRYTDTGLVNDQTYFYALEDIESGGKTKRHGPVPATPRAGTSTTQDPSPGDGSNGSITFGNPQGASLRVLKETSSEMLLELLVDGFNAVPREDGTVEVSVPGLSESTEPGVPSIPIFRTWLPTRAKGKGRVASVETSGVETFTSFRLASTSLMESVGTRAGTVELRRARRGAVSRADIYPRADARIVEDGFQGEARKILIEMAPLRADSRSHRLRLTRRLLVRLVFSGDSADPSEPVSYRRSSVVRRLRVRERGLYAARFEELWGGGRTSVSTSRLRLSRQGVAVPFHVEPDPELFGPGSLLYFLSDGGDLNPYGHDAVYELTREPGLRMNELDRSSAGGGVAVAWHRIEREENHFYQAGLVDADDLWLWDLLLAPVLKTYEIALEDLDTASGSGRLEVVLQGLSDFAADPDHHVRLFLNGSLLGERSWDGKSSVALNVEVPPGVLREGQNTLGIENAGDTRATYSMVMLNRFALTYPRFSVAIDGVFEGRFSEAGRVEIQGLEGDALALDVTGTAPLWVRNGGNRLSVEADHAYFAVSPQSVLRPSVETPGPGRLKSNLEQADYVVVGPSSLLAAAQPLLDLRRTQGLRTRAVSIEDVYSEFGFGEPRPQALRDFLAYAYHHWRKPALRYVLLLGDGTYDFKDYLGTGVQNGVPPLLVKTSYLWTASDPAYATVNGEDGLSDLAIGRLPAQSLLEAQRMIEKVLLYESRPRAEHPPVLVADNADGAGDFEADAEALATDVLSGMKPERIYLGRLGVDATRAAVAAAFDRGASLVSYIGHGGIHLWASEDIFDLVGVQALAQQEQQPFVLTLNCLNGYFHFPYFNSLAEELLKAPGKGAVAAVSPSGLSLNGPAQAFHRVLLEEMLSGRHLRLGDALAAAQARYAETGAFPDLLLIYHLFGDPALSLH